MSNEQITRIITINKEMEKTLQAVTKAVIGPAFSALREFAKQTAAIVATEYMRGLTSALGKFAQDMQNVKNSPDSIFSYVNYQKELDSVHWAWPYDIDTNVLKNMLESIADEKAFDELMLTFFNEEKISKMVDDIEQYLPSRHRMMLRQTKRAFDRKDYAIANNALMSIIDNSLACYLVNEGNTRRCGILKPIIEYYGGFPLDEVEFIFELCMLSNNIDFIFQDYSFNQKIVIDSRKKVRRHLSVHGVKYSNKKIDTLLLFNTLANLVRISPVLDKFVGGLEGKKEFKFSDELWKRLDEESYKETIWLIIESEKKITHKEILKRLCEIYPDDFRNQGKRLTKILQKMKSQNKLVRCVKEDSRCYWMIDE